MTAQAPVGIGLIGTGNISEAYLKGAASFPVLRIVACADANPDIARAKAATWGIEAVSVADLLADPRIDIVLNLTTPQHHVDVGLQALAAGKHVYSEKPLAIDMAQALRLVAAAKEAGLRVGSAPDTFLGGSHQTARAAIDAGAIGEVVAGSAFMMVPGHEIWHPNPDFYYRPGGGPMLDMGPYYLTCLVNLLGPVASVSGAATASYATRTIGSGPRAGEVFDVQVPTHISGLLGFENGAAVTITTSFDVWKHGHTHIELYGRTGSMIVPDPNRFQGEVLVSDRRSDWTAVPQAHGYGDGNYRILGLADMALAIRDGRPHRASLELALHVLEVMAAITTSASTGQRIDLAHGCARPEALRADMPFGTPG
jgi:predicted dehydrogenase